MVLYEAGLENQLIIVGSCQSENRVIVNYKNSKVSDLEITSTSFLVFMIILVLFSDHHYHLRNIGKVRKLLFYDIDIQLLHALISSLFSVIHVQFPKE